ncbi:MAG: Na+/H+ antiporter NhaA [Acidiferrobacterales bacterium]
MYKRFHFPDSYYAPWEKTFGAILSPFEEFVRRQTSGGIVLIVCAVIALVVANSPLAVGYNQLLHTHLSISFGGWTLDHTVHHWINEGLMAMFFFVVGLEIKREILTGDLSEPRAATLPVLTAIGGMVVPALIYILINFGGTGARGWGIPMATDIAFALGILTLLGNRVPKSLFAFLVAVAIVDDLGAVVVIALFYTEQLIPSALLLAALLFGALVVLNRAGARSPVPYFIVGLLLWLAMLESGVHATIAGVLAALTIPSRPKLEPKVFRKEIMRLAKELETIDRGKLTAVKEEERRGMVQAIENAIHKVQSPLQRLENSLHALVAFFVVPLFALTNAGVPLDPGSLNAIVTHPVALGIVLGLVAGKLIGIAAISVLAVKLDWAELPANCQARHMIGVSLLAGIGFTMSIFIAELGLGEQAELLVTAKTGILAASLVAAVAGYIWLYRLGESARAPGTRRRRSNP